MSEENNTRYGTCRWCHRSITGRGSGFYHNPSERDVEDSHVPAHFAEPMNQMQKSTDGAA